MNGMSASAQFLPQSATDSETATTAARRIRKPQETQGTSETPLLSSAVIAVVVIALVLSTDIIFKSRQHVDENNRERRAWTARELKYFLVEIETLSGYAKDSPEVQRLCEEARVWCASHVAEWAPDDIVARREEFRLAIEREKETSNRRRAEKARLAKLLEEVCKEDRVDIKHACNETETWLSQLPDDAKVETILEKRAAMEEAVKGTDESLFPWKLALALVVLVPAGFAVVRMSS